MTAGVPRDVLSGAVVAVGYLVVLLVLWPMVDRPPAWPDAALAVLVGGAAVVTRWAREH